MKKENHDTLFDLYEEKISELRRLQQKDKEKTDKTKRQELLDQIQVLYTAHDKELNSYNIIIGKARQLEWKRHIQKRLDEVFGPCLLCINSEGCITIDALPKKESE